MNELNNDDLRDVIQFHGHLCPGLALGYRIAKAALRELKADRPRDEELVAIVENDSCAVDAVQFITGCTFGKGNLIFRDYGKHVYTFFNRRTGQGVRISEDYRGFEDDQRFPELRKRQEAGEDVARDVQMFKMEKASAILKADEKEIFTITAGVFASTGRSKDTQLAAMCDVRREVHGIPQPREERQGRVHPVF